MAEKFPVEDKEDNKKEVDIPDCPVHSVVVYPDRAEVSLSGLLAYMQVYCGFHKTCKV